MGKIPFWKLQGTGNDFILIDGVRDEAALQHIQAERVIQWCDRRFGVGADQVLVLREASNAKADVTLEIWNADGSRAEMCGNGLRAVGLYLHETRGPGADSTPTPTSPAVYRLLTPVGVREVHVWNRDRIAAEIGAPQVVLRREREDGHLQISTGETVTLGAEVHVGNPHVVIFVDKEEPLEASRRWGAEIERHPRFAPGRTNAEFARVTGSRSLKVEIWERGVGRTLSCGSGVTAAVAAAICSGKVKGPVVDVEVPGGQLRVKWPRSPNPDDDTHAHVDTDAGTEKSLPMAWLEGPARMVFRGELEI